MDPIALAEIISAVFALVSLISLSAGHESSKSLKRIKFIFLLSLIWLTVDALSYILNVPGNNLTLIYALNLIAFCMSNLMIIAYFHYCEAYLSEKIKISRWLFRAPMIILAVNIIIDIIYFCLGKIAVVVNGVVEITSSGPHLVLAIDGICLFYPPIIAYFHRKKIGLKPVVLLIAYSLPSIISIIIFAFTGFDLTVIASALAAIIVVSVLQNDLNQEKLLLDAARASEEALRQSLMDQMSRDDGVFLIDCVNDRRKTLHDNTSGAMVSEKEPYSVSVKRYIDNFVVESDRKMMHELTSAKYMLARTREESEYNVKFRDTSKGMQRFYEMRVARFSDTEVIQSFKENDKEIVERLVFERLKDDYYGLFGIDLDSGLFQVVKESPWYPTGGEGTVASYKDTMTKYAASHEGETREFIEKIGDVEYLKKRFAKENKATNAYRSVFIEVERWICVTQLVLERHPDGTPSLMALCFSFLDEDAREKEELREQLKSALDAADAANKSKSNFLFNMSHDIRTPMNAIMGFTNMAKKYADDKNRVSEYLDKIDISGQQLLMLINQVLEMARIESGKTQLDIKPVNVRERFDQMVTVLSEHARANGLKFHYSLADIEHSNVLADDARTGSITLNIAGNAMKYTPAGGAVDFSLKEIAPRKEGCATFVFTVSDTGIGMSEEYLRHLFEPFTREKSSTVSRIQGTGLGMSIVKNLVDLMGGSIEVHSEEGRGTRFDVTIDFAIDYSAVGASQSANDWETVSFAGKRLLLVEDNEMNREIARDILISRGFEVDDANDGDVAVRIMEDIAARGEYTYYDAVLMDAQMPKMDGYEATRRIRAIVAPDGIHVPIIAMTANAFEEDRRNALESGMDEHLAKPIDTRKLFETLSRFIK